MPRAAVAATAFFGVGLVVMTVFFFWPALARSLTKRVLGVVSPRLGETVAGIIERTSDGLRFLTDYRHVVPYLVVTVFSVVANVWALQLLAWGVGLRLDFAAASVVLGVLAIGFALPNAPGFFGAVQLALYAGLALYLSPEMVTREGASFVFIYYVSYLGVVLGLALMAMILDYALPEAPGAVQLDLQQGP